MSDYDEEEFIRTWCEWCGDDLPVEPENRKGPRRRFCPRPARCQKEHKEWELSHDCED